MTPADFYLGSRQLAGQLVPGFLWLCAAYLLASPARLWQMAVRASGLSFASWVFVLAISLVVGTIAQPLHWIALDWIERARDGWRRWPATWLNALRGKLNTKLAWLVPSGWAATKDENDSLYSAVRTALETRKLVTSPSVPRSATEGGSSTTLDWTTRREVYRAAKRILIATDSKLVPHLIEIDAELNILGTVVLPLIVIAFALSLRASEIPDLGLKGSALAWRFGLPIGGVIALAYLVYALLRVGRYATNACLSAFLVEPKTAPPLAKSDPGIGACVLKEMVEAARAEAARATSST